MATPDPHAAELCLMTYEPRPRVCKTNSQTPKRGDFIEVLWCLDNLPGLPDRWCIAEVLHISGPPERDYIASGVILYLPGETWDEEIHFVEFLPGHKLRCAPDNTGPNSSSMTDGEEALEKNPELDWMYSINAESLCEKSDEEWQESQDGWHRGKGDLRSNVRSEVNNPDKSNFEITALRNGHAALVVEVEKLKRELLRHSQKLFKMEASVSREYICTNAGCVMHKLRHRLALRLQGGLKKTSSTGIRKRVAPPEQTFSTRNGDGMHPGILKARVECTLQQFEAIARQVRATSKPLNAEFFPDFAYTQMPCRGMQNFRILFQTFASLCDQLGVTSLSDRKEMARKCALGEQHILRVLGTYQYNPNDASSPARIYIGSSCGSTIGNAISPDIDEAQELTAVPDHGMLYPVLHRESREWDMVDMRFKHRLQMRHISLHKLNGNTAKSNAFELCWERAPDLGWRTWSKSLSEPVQDIGWLEVSLPCIQMQGRNLCVEVVGLAGDEVWDQLLAVEKPT